MKKTDRVLYPTIVEFIESWEDVVEKKLLECTEDDGEKKEALMAKNKAKAAESPNSPFAFIYNWLAAEVDEDGNAVIQPHHAKNRNNGDATRKMRTGDHPVAADIADYFCCRRGGVGNYKHTESIVQSVYRALSKLVADDKIKREGNLYFSNNISDKRKNMVYDLASMKPLKEDCFFSVSKSTYIINFDNGTPNLKHEIKLFKSFLDKNCFDVFSYENRIVVLIKGKQEKCKSLGIQLRKMVKDAYTIQQEASKGV